MKYTLRKDLKLELGLVTLYRIERISTKKLGGWIESEKNLSQEGEAWVLDNAMVLDNARVSGNARVSDSALVCDNAQVYSNAMVSGYVRVYGHARVYGDAKVSGNAEVSGNARLFRRSDLFHAIVGNSYPITATPQNITVGCQIKTHAQWLKVTKKQAVDMGLPADMYAEYRKLIKLAVSFIKKGSKK